MTEIGGQKKHICPLVSVFQYGCRYRKAGLSDPGSICTITETDVPDRTIRGIGAVAVTRGMDTHFSGWFLFELPLIAGNPVNDQSIVYYYPEFLLKPSLITVAKIGSEPEKAYAGGLIHVKNT